MASGVTVSPNCAEVFNELKLGHKHRYIIYAMTENLKEITVEKTATPDATYDEFVAELKAAEAKGECRYGAFDLQCEIEGRKCEKILLFMWAPDGAKIKQKMVYTSSKDYLRRALVGVSKEIQATDDSELSYEHVLSQVKA